MLSPGTWREQYNRTPMQSAGAPHLTESDVRNLTRLLGDVIAAGGSHAEKKRLLMDGICQLIGAESWVWTLAQLNENGATTHLGFLQGGFDDDRFARFLEAIEHPDTRVLSEPLAQALHSGAQEHLTRLRQQMDPEDKFLTFDGNRAWELADIGPLLVSLRKLPDSGVSGIGIYRRQGGEPFTEREAKIAHILLSEVGWLHLQDWPADRGESVIKLSPRQRVVLNALILGWNRKKIADHLKLSVHTVHGYVKGVFHHFGVHSQAELISRFSWGNGGDSPHLGNGKYTGSCDTFTDQQRDGPSGAHHETL